MASPIAEAKCAVCGSWPASQRDEMRKLINELEFKKIDLTCDKCVEAFWLNCMSASEKRRKQDDSMSSSSSASGEHRGVVTLVARSDGAGWGWLCGSRRAQ